MLSVIICTWNRHESLQVTLESLCQLTVPSGFSWELIVVDNNSTDATSQIIDSFKPRLPIVSIFEPNSGKSHALNTAVQKAQGKYLVFTDDDVIVDSNWLIAYQEAFKTHPEDVIFGGPIEPQFEGNNTPDWLKEGFNAVANAYAIIEPTQAIGPITDESYPYGANMAVHRRVFEKHRYPTEIGPRPGSKVRGEEMMLIWEVLRSGETGSWVSEAKVLHSIPTSRQSMTYLRDYYLGSGELMDLIDESDVPLLFGRPRWAWRRVVEEQFHYLLGRYTSPAPVWLGHFRSACIARGLLGGFKHNTRV